VSQRSLRDKVLDFLWPRPKPSPASIKPGIYSYQRLIGEWPTRFHLRVDPDGFGLLLANASEAAQLSPSGVHIARAILQDRTDEDIIREVLSAFPDATAEQIQADVARVRDLIAQLSEPGDNYPITDLDDPLVSDRTRSLWAPLRACVVPGELDATSDVLRRLWDAGVPHSTIIIQPDSQIGDIPRLVEVAEDIGMIAGVRSVASWLPEDVVDAAAQAGLDHLDLLYTSSSAQQHDDLVAEGDHDKAFALFQRCREVEVCRVAQVPLIEHNIDQLDEMLATLHDQDVSNISFFAVVCLDDDETAQKAGALAAKTLPQVATNLIEASERANARYLWLPPVRFDDSRPLAEQVKAGPRTDGDGAIRVEKDGSVFAARGPRKPAGNILADPWESIWHSDVLKRYRERLAQPTRCSRPAHTVLRVPGTGDMCGRLSQGPARLER